MVDAILTSLVSSLILAAPCSSAQLVGSGAVAPCSGLLVPEGEAKTAALCVATRLPSCQLDLEELRRRMTIEVETAARELDAVQTERDALRRLLDRVQAPPPVPWYREPWFVGPAAAAGAVLATLAVVWAAGVL